MLDAFADRVSKPHLLLTDKMQLALGKNIKVSRSWCLSSCLASFFACVTA